MDLHIVMIPELYLKNHCVVKLLNERMDFQ